MRYLGLDLGTKTLGIAISDKTNTLACPLKTIRFIENDYESLVSELLNIITDNDVSEIALGFPKNMDNSEGFAAQRSKDFKQMLEKHTSIPIAFIDERLSSVEAHNILFGLGKKNQDRKKIVDEVAATIILDNFLKMKGR